MILKGTKFIQDLVDEFCKTQALKSPRVTLYDSEEYTKETADTEGLSCYSPELEAIALSPGIEFAPKLILHELAHHFQRTRDGLQQFNKKYDDDLERYGYRDSPYEIEARELGQKWWPDFEELLIKKLKE